MSILKTISKEDVKFLMDFDYNNVLGRLKFILGDKASFFADVRVKQKEVTWSTRDDREFCCYSNASDTEKKILRDKVNEHIGIVSAIISGDSLVGPYTEKIVSYPSNSYIYYVVENNNYNVILTGWGCDKTYEDEENTGNEISSNDVVVNETSLEERNIPSIESICSENNDWIAFGDNRYRGQLKEGKPHGIGEMKLEDCSYCKGSWQEGKMSGYGEMIWPSGKKYEGEWKGGFPNGRGKMFYPNGNIYEGEFSQGVREGHGVLLMPNGDIIEGLFNNDNISSQSVFADSKGNKKDFTISNNDKSFLSRVWHKTWRLWVSVACFAFAIICAIWVFDFFSGNGPSRMRANAIFAPIIFGYLGIRFLFDFLWKND